MKTQGFFRAPWDAFITGGLMCVESAGLFQGRVGSPCMCLNWASHWRSLVFAGAHGVLKWTRWIEEDPVSRS